MLGCWPNLGLKIALQVPIQGCSSTAMEANLASNKYNSVNNGHVKGDKGFPLGLRNKKYHFPANDDQASIKKKKEIRCLCKRLAITGRLKAQYPQIAIYLNENTFSPLVVHDSNAISTCLEWVSNIDPMIIGLINFFSYEEGR